VAEIWPDEAARTWLLEMSTTSYALGLTPDRTAVRHLHWGAPVPRAAVAGMLADAVAAPVRWERMRGGPGREYPDEYVPWGGLRFDEPSLKVTYPDGTRAIEWQAAGHRISRDGHAVTLEIDLADVAYDLAVTLSYRIYDGFDVLERWATIRNGGRAGIVVLQQAHSANWWLPDRSGRPGWRLRYLYGGWSAETQLAAVTLGPGRMVLDSRRGMTSHQFNPWFTVDPGGTATEETGEVWSGELAWSGNWKLVFETSPAGQLHASGGWNDFDSPYHLGPGEQVGLPVFAGLHTTGGFGAASREWHAWQLARVLGRGEPGRPRARFVSSSGPPAANAGPATAVVAPDAAPRLRPVLYNSWEATSFAVTQPGQQKLADLAARLGSECFVVDDGWFRGRNHDHAGLGDWTVDPAKFPHGLGPLIEHVNGLGMTFGLWVEPEMVNPDSDLYRAHPDWVYHFAHRSRSEHRNQLVLNLARPDVADWVRETLDRLLSANRIGFIKWDMNRPFSEPGWPAAANGNPERIWIDHTRSLYAILDDLRAAHPGVDFESCCGGGGRIDLGILRRVEQAWTSDNTDALDRILIQEGFTQAYTPQAMMAWVTDSPNHLTGRRLPLSFRFHVAMAGSLGIGGDLTQWSEAELTEAAALVAAYKVIRPVVQQGQLYRLASLRTGPLAAHQYLAADGQVVVLAWWAPRSSGTRLPRLRLAGLDSAARYADARGGQVHDGAALMAQGLPLPSASDFDYGSTLVHLTPHP
jgi:alpha-galactosidase